MKDLLAFYDAVDSLTADGGGDGPEYALDAMLRALKFEDEDDYGTPFPVMIEGSHMVVITDAPTKNQGIEKNVTKLANERGVCIHFFVSDHDTYIYGETLYTIYQRVADGTSGTLIDSFSSWDFAIFTSSYQDSPCAHELKRRKRAAPASSAPQCHSFHISELTILFRFSAETDSTVTLTSPSGSTITVSSIINAAVHSERFPEHGEWMACLTLEA